MSTLLMSSRFGMGIPLFAAETMRDGAVADGRRAVRGRVPAKAPHAADGRSFAHATHGKTSRYIVSAIAADGRVNANIPNRLPITAASLRLLPRESAARRRTALAEWRVCPARGRGRMTRGGGTAQGRGRMTRAVAARRGAGIASHAVAARRASGGRPR